MPLTDDQIQHLFRFTEKKSVRSYDLQIELVDHLASRIEEEMEADKGMSFEKALEKVYKGFGLFGFAKVLQEKQTQLQRAARKIWWQEIGDFFTWPKVVLLALLVSVFWTLTQLFPLDLLYIGFLAAYIVAGLVLLTRTVRYKKARKELLLLKFGGNHLSSVVFFYQLFVVSMSDNVSAVGFCIVATVGVLIKTASFQLYRKVKDKAFTLYPEAFA